MNAFLCQRGYVVLRIVCLIPPLNYFTMYVGIVTQSVTVSEYLLPVFVCRHNHTIESRRWSRRRRRRLPVEERLCTYVWSYPDRSSRGAKVWSYWKCEALTWAKHTVGFGKYSNEDLRKIIRIWVCIPKCMKSFWCVAEVLLVECSMFVVCMWRGEVFLRIAAILVLSMFFFFRLNLFHDFYYSYWLLLLVFFGFEKFFFLAQRY